MGCVENSEIQLLFCDYFAIEAVKGEEEKITGQINRHATNIKHSQLVALSVFITELPVPHVASQESIIKDIGTTLQLYNGKSAVYSIPHSSAAKKLH